MSRPTSVAQKHSNNNIRFHRVRFLCVKVTFLPSALGSNATLEVVMFSTDFYSLLFFLQRTGRGRGGAEVRIWNIGLDEKWNVENDNGWKCVCRYCVKKNFAKSPIFTSNARYKENERNGLDGYCILWKDSNFLKSFQPSRVLHSFQHWQ